MIDEWRKPPPDGCASVEEHERSLLALAQDLEKRSRELLVSDGRVTVATANQLALASIKARAKAADLALAREQTEYGEWLVAQKKRMRTGATSLPPRPPLQFVRDDPDGAA